MLGVMCASHGWSCLRLDGSCSVKQRQALVDTFNNPQVAMRNCVLPFRVWGGSSVVITCPGLGN